MSNEQEIIDLLKDLHKKIDIVIEGKSKKATPSAKVKQFITKTEDLLASEEPLCAYMQKNDCVGHCGKPAKFSVIKGNPIELTELTVKKPKDKQKELERKCYFRCNTCKNKGKEKSNSKAYSKIFRHIYGPDDDENDDTVLEEGLSEIIGQSPKVREKKESVKQAKNSKKEKQAKNSKNSKHAKSEEKEEEQEEKEEEEQEDSEEDDPQEKNPHLKSNDRYQDKLVEVKKKKVILRCYTDRRKKDVCIGILDEEPEDEDYEELLKKPKQSLLDKMDVKYKTPEESDKVTPPPVETKKVKKSDEEDDDDEDEEEDDDDEDDEDEDKAFNKMVNGEDEDD